MILTLTPKLDHEKTQAEVRTMKNQISDLDYTTNTLTAKLSDAESKTESF
jgi:hypothetical protein